MSQSAPQAKPWPAVSLAEARAILTAPGSRFEMEEKPISGVTTRVWKHAPPTLRDVFLAGMGHGERVFLVHEDERASYRAFSRAALALAHALIEAANDEDVKGIVALAEKLRALTWTLRE